MPMNQTTGETVTVSLRRTYGYGGTYYGPGESVEVPVGLATSLGLMPNSPAKPVSLFPEDGTDAAARHATEVSSQHEDEPDSDEGQDFTLEELPAHLATLTTAEDVRAARKGDTRKGAKPLYAARLAEISGA